MKKIEGNKLVALLISAGMVTTVLAACSIDYDEFGAGINDPGNAFMEETEAPKATTAEADEETEESLEETTEETEPDATPTATPTATPSPTPLPQRVDFSEYTEDILTDSFTVATEEFSESAFAEDDEDVLFATFEGERLVVTEASSENVRDSINIFVDGFYAEAEGAYARMTANATTEYKLSGVVEEPYTVTVDFEYTTNARVLSVFMRYDVTGGDEAATVMDFASFDMLSGQFITIDSLTADSEGFTSALTKEFVSVLKDQAEEATEDIEEDEELEEIEEIEEIEETTVTTTAAEIPSAKDFEEIYVAAGPAATESDSGAKITVYGIANGVVYVAEIDIEDAGLDEYLNRYGKSVLIG